MFYVPLNHCFTSEAMRHIELYVVSANGKNGPRFERHSGPLLVWLD